MKIIIFLKSGAKIAMNVAAPDDGASVDTVLEYIPDALLWIDSEQIDAIMRVDGGYHAHD